MQRDKRVSPGRGRATCGNTTDTEPKSKNFGCPLKEATGLCLRRELEKLVTCFEVHTFSTPHFTLQFLCLSDKVVLQLPCLSEKKRTLQTA